MLRSLCGRSVDHQVEALLGCRQLRDVVLWVGPAYVLLHGTVSLLLQPHEAGVSDWSIFASHLPIELSHDTHPPVPTPISTHVREAMTQRGTASGRGQSGTHAEAALPAAGAIVVLEGADDDIVSIRDGEAVLQGRGVPWWHLRRAAAAPRWRVVVVAGSGGGAEGAPSGGAADGAGSLLWCICGRQWVVGSCTWTAGWQMCRGLLGVVRAAVVELGRCVLCVCERAGGCGWLRGQERGARCEGGALAC